MLARCETLQSQAGSLTSSLIEALEIDIPDSSTKIGLDTLRLRHLKCNKGQIGGLLSSVALPSKLYGTVTDAALHCDGSYSYGLIHGTLNAAIKISSLALHTAVWKDPQSQYPSVMNSSSCRIPSLDIRLKFSRGFTGAVLNTISRLVKSMIEAHVKSKVCAKLTDLISVGGTNMLITKVHPTIDRVLDLGTPDIPGSSSDPSLSMYVHWADSDLGSANEILFNGISGALDVWSYGKKMEKDASMHPSYVGYIIRCLTYGTGKWTVDLGSTSFLAIPSNAKIETTVTFHRMSLSGLQTLTLLDLIHPSPIYNFSVGSTFHLDQLNIEIDFSICSEITNVTICEQSKSKLITKLEDVTVTMNCSVGAIQNKLSSVHRNDLFSSKFWFSAIDFFNISSQSLKSKAKSIAVQYVDTKYDASQIGTWTSNLDTGIEYLMDNALHLLVSEYKDLTESVIAAAVQGPARRIANHHIAALLAQHKSALQHQDTKYNQDTKDSSRLPLYSFIILPILFLLWCLTRKAQIAIICTTCGKDKGRIHNHGYSSIY